MNTNQAGFPVADPAPNPPAVRWLPLVGNALDMARDPSAFFVQMYRQYGSVFRIKVLGNEYTVLAGPEANLFMSREGAGHLRSREFWQGMVEEFGATTLLVAEDGERHAAMRKVMQPGFSRSVLNGRYQELIDITDSVLARDWQPGADVPVVKMMQRLVTEQLGLIIADQSPGEYVDDIRLFIKRILNVRVTKQRPGFMMHLPDYKRAKNRFFELGQSMLDNHQSDPDRPTILIDDLLRASHERPDLFPESDLVSEVVSPYIAGLDTVANTTSSFVYAVLKHPPILQRVRAEADALFAQGTPTMSMLKKDAPTLFGAYMETLRLYPIAVAAMRNADSDFVFEGNQVHEGEPIYMATAVSHFLPEFYPDPYAFDVDRPVQQYRQPGAFAPFGLGQHTCLGAGMAEILILLSMATLFNRLDLQLSPPDYELKISVAPTPGPEANFKVRVAGRRH